jgi:hypothetical protein
LIQGIVAVGGFLLALSGESRRLHCGHDIIMGTSATAVVQQALMKIIEE